MRKIAFVLGVLFVLLAVIVFAFAEGLRRWYTGIFFAIIGVVALANARWRGDAEK